MKFVQGGGGEKRIMFHKIRWTVGGEGLHKYHV